MNTERADESIFELPKLSDERVEEIEAAVFGRIARERRTRSRTRRRGFIGAASAAAAVVLIVVIAPVAGRFVVDGGSGASVADSAPDEQAIDSGRQFTVPEAAAPAAADGAVGSDAGSVGAVSPVQARDIVTTASATVRVDDVSDALAAITSQAQGRGGYVESMSADGTTGAPLPVDGVYPTPVSGAGYITVRIPAADLDTVVSELSDLGEVQASGVARQDVTAQTVDLRARIDAAQASVDRLTVLMSQAGSVGDVITAESALADRQATLESYQQQLKALDDQVALSSLTVTVVPRAAAVVADPAGFGDGLAAGWNGLVATVNGIVIGIGFLLPWITLAAVAAVIVWVVIRLVRGRRRPRTDPAA